MQSTSAPLLPEEQVPGPRTALVTGATSGIGRALILPLLARGVEVVATGRDAARLESLAEEARVSAAARVDGVSAAGPATAPGRLHTVACDLARPEAPAELHAESVRRLGRPVELLICSAGYNSRKAALVDTTDEELDGLYAVNLRAPVILSRLTLASLLGRGHIVQVGSTVVHHGCERMALYTAMKQGLLGLHSVLVKEGRARGVKVTLVHPGGTDSGFRVEARPDYLRPASVAHMILGAVFAPPDVVVHELTFRPMVESNF